MAQSPSTFGQKCRSILPWLGLLAYFFAFQIFPIQNGDGAVYWQQILAGDLSQRTIHLGYFWPLLGIKSVVLGLGLAADTAIPLLHFAFYGLLLWALSDLGRGAGVHPLIFTLFIVAHPGILGEIHRLEVYLPQFAVFSAALALSRRGGHGFSFFAAGLFLAWVLLISPTTLLWLPLFILLAPDIKGGAKSVLLACVLAAIPILFHFQDYFWGPRGLLMASPADLSPLKGMIAGLKALSVAWPMAFAFFLRALAQNWGKKNPISPAILGLGLIPPLFFNRYSDVPLYFALLIPMGWWIARWPSKTPARWALMAALLLQGIMADTQIRHEHRKFRAEKAALAELSTRLTPRDHVVGEWGALHFAAHHMDLTLEGERGLLRPELTPAAVQKWRCQGHNLYLLPPGRAGAFELGSGSEIVELPPRWIQKWPALAPADCPVQASPAP